MSSRPRACHPIPGVSSWAGSVILSLCLWSSPMVFDPLSGFFILFIGRSSSLFCCVILSNVLGSCPRGRHPVLGSVILAQGPPSCSRDGQTVSGFVSLVSPRLYCLFQDMSPCLWVWHFVPGYVTRFLGLSARSV